MSKVDYDENHFISDYTFLEETARTIRTASRTRQDLHYTSAFHGTSNSDAMSKGRMNLLAREAALRNTELHFLPSTFARHRRNHTFAKRPMKVGNDTKSDVKSTGKPKSSGVGKSDGSSPDKRNAQCDDIPRIEHGSKSDNKVEGQSNGHCNDNPGGRMGARPEERPVKELGATRTDGGKAVAGVSADDGQNVDGRVLHWSVDMHLHNGSNSRLVKVPTCAESATMRDVVDGVLRSVEKSTMGRKQTKTLPLSPSLSSFLKQFCSEAAEGLAIYMRNESVLAAQCARAPLSVKRARADDGDYDARKYVPVEDETKTLGATLNGRCIVEFPVFDVAVKGSEAEKQLKQACCGIFGKAEEEACDKDSTSEMETDSDGAEDESEREVQVGDVTENEAHVFAKTSDEGAANGKATASRATANSKTAGPNAADCAVGDANGGDRKNPDGKTPDSTSPCTKGPLSKAPDARTPDADAPDADTPNAVAPDAVAPDAKTPDLKRPDGKMPCAQTSDAKTAVTKMPGAKNADANTPGAKNLDLNASVARNHSAKGTSPKAPGALSGNDLGGGVSDAEEGEIRE